MTIETHSGKKFDLAFPFAVKIAGAYLYCKSDKQCVLVNYLSDTISTGNTLEMLDRSTVFRVLNPEAVRDIAETIILHAQQILR